MNDALHNARPAPPGGYRNLYATLTALLVLTTAGIFVLGRVEQKPERALPLEFRLTRLRLSNLPVSVDDVISCSCWDGPRNQAERKYRFHLVNDSDGIIDIGGGTKSQIRLIVAYPTKQMPSSLTLPRPSPSDESGRFDTPNDVDLQIANSYGITRPSHLLGANRLFGVPSNYSIWAIPPVPNKLAEIVSETRGGRRGGTFPTVVDKTHLLPGEGYRGASYGHGDWTFYIPIDRWLRSTFQMDLQPVMTDADIENHIIFVGIGVFLPKAKALADLIGFAPAPSDAALLDPSAF